MNKQFAPAYSGYRSAHCVCGVVDRAAFYVDVWCWFVCMSVLFVVIFVFGCHVCLCCFRLLFFIACVVFCSIAFCFALPRFVCFCVAVPFPLRGCCWQCYALVLVVVCPSGVNDEANKSKTQVVTRRFWKQTATHVQHINS